MKKTYLDIKKNLKPFNDKFVKEFRKSQINGILDKLDITFRNVVNMLQREDLTYKGYVIVPPNERVVYELSRTHYSNNTLNIKNDEMILVKFVFVEANELYEKYLYVPYEFNNAFVIGGTSNFLIYLIFEKMFFKIKNGINLKIRLPIHFTGHEKVKQYTSLEDYKFIDTTIKVKIHNKESKGKTNTTIMHYLLALYGFEQILDIFNAKDIKISSNPVNDKNVLNFDVTPSRNKEAVILSCNKQRLEQEYIYKRVVSSLIDVFATSRYKFKVDSVYTESIPLFKLVLGTLIYDKGTNLSLISEHVTNHLMSLASYVDSITIEKLKELNIKNIWELLIYVFVNYEIISNNVKNNNLFDKRIDLIDYVIEELITRNIYSSVFKMMSRNNVTRSIRNVKIYDNAFSNIKHLKSKKSGGFLYNCSMLIPLVRAVEGATIGNIGISQGKSKEVNTSIQSTLNHFHISSPLVKQANFTSSADPAKNAILNYFANIDKDTGNVIVNNQELLDSLKILD